MQESSLQPTSQFNSDLDVSGVQPSSLNMAGIVPATAWCAYRSAVSNISPKISPLGPNHLLGRMQQSGKNLNFSVTLQCHSAACNCRAALPWRRRIGCATILGRSLRQVASIFKFSQHEDTIMFHSHNNIQKRTSDSMIALVLYIIQLLECCNSCI